MQSRWIIGLASGSSADGVDAALLEVAGCGLDVRVQVVQTAYQPYGRELHDLLRLNDFPDPTSHSPGRVPTTTPLQQLFTLNSPFLQQQAAALARRLKAEVPGDDAARVRLM